MTMGRKRSSGWLVAFLAPRLIFVSFLFLGLPLGGTVPIPADMFRESGGASSEATEVLSNNLASALVWGAVYAVALLLVFLEPKSSMRCIKRTLPVISLLTLSLASAIWSTRADKAVLDGLQMFGLLAVCVLAANYYQNDISLLLKNASFAFGINLTIQLAFILAFPDKTSHYDGRWAGVTGSANYLGALACCSIWANLAWLSVARTKNVLVSNLFLVFAFIVLLKTNSVTSTIATLVSVFFFVYLWSTSLTKWRVAKTVIFYAGTFIILAGSLFAGLGFFLELVGRSESASGRDVIWLAAIRLIQDGLVLGHGIGSDTESLGALHWATTFHNGYLEIGVKLGFLGLFLFVCLIYQGLSVLLKTAYSREVRISIFAFMASYLVYNMAESAVLAARSPMWVVLLVLFSTIRMRGKELRIK